MYYDVVEERGESNSRVTELSEGQIISLMRFVQSSSRWSVIGYTRQPEGRIFMREIFEARCTRVQYPGLRVNYSFRIRFSYALVGLLTLDCGPRAQWMHHARHVSNSRSLFKLPSHRTFMLLLTIFRTVFLMSIIIRNDRLPDINRENWCIITMAIEGCLHASIRIERKSHLFERY